MTRMRIRSETGRGCAYLAASASARLTRISTSSGEAVAALPRASAARRNSGAAAVVGRQPGQSEVGPTQFRAVSRVIGVLLD